MFVGCCVKHCHLYHCTDGFTHIWISRILGVLLVHFAYGFCVDLYCLLSCLLYQLCVVFIHFHYSPHEFHVWSISIENSLKFIDKQIDRGAVSLNYQPMSNQVWNSLPHHLFTTQKNIWNTKWELTPNWWQGYNKEILLTQILYMWKL